MDLSRLSDEELMLTARKGNLDACDSLYNRHKGPLINFCYQMLHNSEDAADVFQDTFRYIFSHIQTYKPTAKFTTYLYHIARNHCIDILRRRKRWGLVQLDTEIDSEDPHDERSSMLEQGEIESRIKKAFEEIPEAYREVVVLRVIQGLPYDEIAEIMGCPMGTVKSRLHAGLEILRQVLKRKKIVE